MSTKTERIELTSSESNPYAAPPTPVEETISDSALVAKIEAIIKDADQYLFAIFLCLVCTGLGPIIIGPWYFSRLRQWNSLAESQPKLLETNVAPGSIAQRFQAAKSKLFAGMAFGVVCLTFAFGLLAILLIGS